MSMGGGFQGAGRATRPRLLGAGAMLALAACTAPKATTPTPVAGDPLRGAAVAAQWCSDCHTVRGVEADKTRGPTFQQIAARPGRDAPYLAAFLEQDHFPMTTYRLLAGEKADIVALILAQRP